MSEHQPTALVDHRLTEPMRRALVLMDGRSPTEPGANYWEESTEKALIRRGLAEPRPGSRAVLNDDGRAEARRIQPPVPGDDLATLYAATELRAAASHPHPLTELIIAKRAALTQMRADNPRSLYIYPAETHLAGLEQAAALTLDAGQIQLLLDHLRGAA